MVADNSSVEFESKIRDLNGSRQSIFKPLLMTSQKGPRH
jgi:hypothetical protein